MLRFISLASLIGFCLLFAVAQSAPPDAGQSAASKTGADALPNGPGKQVVQKDCLSCHSVQITTSKRGTEAAWAATVSQMIGRGAIVSNEDADAIVEYMAQHFGPSVPMPENATPSKQLTPSTASALAPAGTGEISEANLPPVNVNWAAASELEWGLGLTPSEADAIVHYREQHGTFKDLQQLLSVPGIDAEKIRNEQKEIAFNTPSGRIE